MKEHLQNIGKTGTIELEGFIVECTITNVKTAFGRVDYEIAINGRSKYVDSKRVKVQ